MLCIQTTFLASILSWPNNAIADIAAPMLPSDFTPKTRIPTRFFARRVEYLRLQK